MPRYTMSKSGERVSANSDAERDELIALGYAVETDPEQDPQDRAPEKLRLKPLAAAPAGPNAVGELYATNAGVLKVCTVAGSPGTWVSVGAQA